MRYCLHKLVPPLPAWGYRRYGPHAFISFSWPCTFSPWGVRGYLRAMALTEIPAWATLSRAREREGLDAPVRIRITQGLEALPLPPLDRQNLTPRGFWRQTGTLSVVGCWLVAVVGEGPGPVDSLHRPLVMTFRQVRGSLKFIDFTVTGDHKQELGPLLSPHQHTTLLPGRVPVGIRYTDPDNYEVWIPLGDTDADKENPHCPQT